MKSDFNQPAYATGGFAGSAGTMSAPPKAPLSSVAEELHGRVALAQTKAFDILRMLGCSAPSAGENNKAPVGPGVYGTLDAARWQFTALEEALTRIEQLIGTKS